MLTQIAYVRQQIIAAQRAGTPSARADHLQRALDGLERVEWQAKEMEPIPDPFLPGVLCPHCGKVNELADEEGFTEGPPEYHAACWQANPTERCEVVPGWTLDELYAREG